MLRWTVTITLLVYGFAKIFGGQFVYDWQEVTFRRSDPHAFTMIWYFFGFSRTYGTFIAACEIVPAVLLHVPRLRTVAAAGIFAVMLNVTVMDWTFGLPLGATLVATALLSASGYLLWIDRRKLAALIERSQ